jgi:hypothetical protein
MFFDFTGIKVPLQFIIEFREYFGIAKLESDLSELAGELGTLYEKIGQQLFEVEEEGLLVEQIGSAVLENQAVQFEVCDDASPQCVELGYVELVLVERALRRASGRARPRGSLRGT